MMRFAMPLLLAACTTQGGVEHLGYFLVQVHLVDGAPAPTPAAPAPPSLPDQKQIWSFTVDAIDPFGNIDPSFEGFARVSVVPGSVSTVGGLDGSGRNVHISAGHGEAEAEIAGIFGATRLWVQDMGYIPAPAGVKPLCANGTDDDDDVLVDFPNDPGCAFADDMDEDSGTLLTGVSQEVTYLLPAVADLQGRQAETPYPSVSAQLRTSPNEVIVTRVASGGFFITDLSEPGHPTAYNHLFAFNFNTPTDMRVCDRLTSLSGTVSEFFGFTEISFPSYEIGLWDFTRPPNECTFENELEVCGPDGYCRRGTCQPCRVPEPVVLDNMIIGSESSLESLESGLVSIDQFRIPPNFGSGLPQVQGTAPPYTFVFGPEASNCDLDQDGVLEFADEREGACSNACSADPNCTDWLGYASRGNYKVAKGNGTLCAWAAQGGGSAATCIMVNTSTATGFSPLAHRGRTILWLSGTLRHFSGGPLNWTVETRCSDDLVCNFDEACVDAQVPSSRACKTPPTRDDNDAGTN